MAEKCAARVIPDEVAKELLSQNELEMDQLDVQKGSGGTSVLTTGDVIEKGLPCSMIGTFWQKSSLTTRQRFQRFLFPEGMTIEGSGFGTSAAGSMPCCESVTVWNPPSLSVQDEGCFCPENVTVVDHSSPTWNLLLAELSELSKIVEQSANDSGRESSRTAVSERAET